MPEGRELRLKPVDSHGLLIDLLDIAMQQRVVVRDVVRDLMEKLREPGVECEDVAPAYLRANLREALFDLLVELALELSEEQLVRFEDDQVLPSELGEVGLVEELSARPCEAQGLVVDDDFADFLALLLGERTVAPCCNAVQLTPALLGLLLPVGLRKGVDLLGHLCDRVLVSCDDLVKKLVGRISVGGLAGLCDIRLPLEGVVGVVT